MQDYIRNIGRPGRGDWDLCVGLDVDKSSISVSVHDRQDIVRWLKMPYDAQNLLSFVRKTYPRKRLTCFGI